MYLKRLELSGFKSFAKTTVLEFPSKITAIVGPNGSGKSNVKEGIQWVLGEQSIKSLRGKRGEDLIWNGSPGSPRMGKASVALTFDNKDGEIPLEFNEVIVGRKIFRDGMNEYFINNSQTRLKDVVELMARIGLGEAKHNIIGQGEVDRILLFNPRERRAVLEEALGLRVYQLKKHEAERKLDATAANMNQVAALVREIAPHLKFLRAQAKKAETRESVEIELRMLEKVYFSKEQREILKEKEDIAARKKPFVAEQEKIKKTLAELSDKIAAAEKEFSESNNERPEESSASKHEARLREIERERGRLEAKLEIEKERLRQPQFRAVDTRYIKEEIEAFITEVRSLLEEEGNLESLRSHLLVLVEDLEALLGKIDRGTIEERKSDKNGLIKSFEELVMKLEAEASEISAELSSYQDKRRGEREEYQKAQLRIRELDSQARAHQDEERDVALQLERIKFEEERLKVREAAFAEELRKAGITTEDVLTLSRNDYESMSGDDIKKKIERTRGKLEEIGGIDSAVVTEYQETESRYSFLSGELEDLKRASGSLKELIKELDGHIKKDFKEGFSKIREEFHNYFRIIFGGGKAILRITNYETRQWRGSQEEAKIDDEKNELQNEDSRGKEEGVEIDVDLPRKRIKGLAMLSGGERALTSIALLFAITAVNPPPFLVLDETDAALDEANSQRYAAILKELAKKTQLLLVTHNRETMKCAGILYGVTMGDDGVSRLLSLKLEEAEMYTNR